jgi:hypothetical protein
MFGFDFHAFIWSDDFGNLRLVKQASIVDKQMGYAI